MITIFRALDGKWMNPREIKAANEEATCKTAFRLRGFAR
jgi:hypothetical protein